MTQAMVKKIVVLLGVAALAACGGGGGGSGQTPPPPDIPQTIQRVGTTCGATTEVIFVATEAAKANTNVELLALACNGQISSPLWVQTAGTPVTFLSARSQAITFEPSATGTHKFRFSYTDTQGQSQSRIVQIEVGAADATAAPVIRGEPSVWPANATSLRVWLPGYDSAALTGATYAWTSTSSTLPNSALQNTKAPNLIITPLTVTQDTVAPVQVVVTLSNGRTLTQSFNLLVPVADATASGAFFQDAAQVYPYVLTDNPFANTLKKCVYARSLFFNLANSSTNLCTLATLPALGQTAKDGIPTVEQVMQRVLVSNDWMGANFERLLREDSTGLLRRMLASTTAVVIGGRVRPAFYNVITGAIYLDAGYLWLTPEQRDTVSERPDYREALAAPFSFELSYWTYEPMGGTVTPSIALESRASRTMDEMRKYLLSLMVHELTHAADYIPSSVFSTLDPSSYLFVAGIDRSNLKLTATGRLGTTYPLQCSSCFQLGAALFQSATPTTAQKALSAADIVRLFEPDFANDFYAYSVRNPGTDVVSPEDTAMLAEEALMQLSYGYRRKTYVLNYINKIYSFQWGQASRIGNPNISRRAKLVVGNTAPWYDQTLFASLEAPRNLTSTAAGTSAAAKNASINAALPLVPPREEIDAQLQDRALRQQLDAKVSAQVQQLQDVLRAQRR